MKNYVILSCEPNSDVADTNIFQSWPDDQVRAALDGLCIPGDLLLGVHCDPKEIMLMLTMLNEVNTSRFGGYMMDTVNAFRTGLQDQGLNLCEQLHSLLHLPSVSEREDAMDQYIIKQDAYCRQFRENPICDRLCVGAQSESSLL
jgi:hypothetical protein